MEIVTTEDLVKRHDNALFGWWEVVTNVRRHGLIEKVDSNHTHVQHIDKRITKMERIQHMMLLIMVFPTLNAMGLPTQELAPFIVKFFLKILAAF